jgi:hypothetical protein
MTQVQSGKKIFYGWYLVAGQLVLFMIAGGLMTYSFPVYMKYIVHLDHSTRRKPRIGHDEIIPGEQFITMPFDLRDHPPGLAPAFRLVLQDDIISMTYKNYILD